MSNKTHANNIRRILNREYPGVQTPLWYNTPFQLLVATILSAQSTDKQVNLITPELFKRLATPEEFACAGLDTIEGLIRSIGLHRTRPKTFETVPAAWLTIIMARCHPRGNSWWRYPAWGVKPPTSCLVPLSVCRLWLSILMLPGSPSGLD